MWFDSPTTGKSRGSRSGGSGPKRRSMFVVNARLKDRKTKWEPQLVKLLIALLVIGIALALVGMAADYTIKAVATENKDFTLTNLVVVCKEDPALAAEILSMEKQLRGTNMFRIDTGKVRERIDGRPCVKSVAVSRILPHKLEILITERLPLARLGNPGDMERRLVVDGDGVVFPKDRSLPLITGYGAMKIKPGDRIGAQVKDALALIEYCSVSPAGRRLRIAAIDIRAEYLEIRLDDGLKVLLNWQRDVADVKVQRREMETRLITLITAMSKALQAGVTLQAVDVAGDNPGVCVTTPRWTGGGE